MRPAFARTATPTVRPEPVEGQGFDRLSPNGLIGTHEISRRQLLHAGVGLTGWLVMRPAQADQLDEAIRAWTGGKPLQNGRVKLDIAPLVDNGNTVPLAVQVDSPMTATDHVVAIAVFNQKNPQADVVRFTLGPRAGRASVATRMRLATTQKLSAVARMSDGSCWQHTVEVIVTLAACLEEIE
jgi:sulfur-oxidizing protein SoxY